MKTILFLIPSLGGGGAERVLVNLVNNLDKTKYKITVQTLFDIGVHKQYLDSEVEYIGGYQKQVRGNVQMFKLFSPQYLYKKIVKRRYDIAVAYLEGPAARIIAGCPFDSKLVSWVHVEQKTRKAAGYSYRSYQEYETCAKRYDITVCVSETVKNDLLSIVSIQNPCMVLYNTNEDSIIKEKAKEEIIHFSKPECVTIFTVGRLRYEKGMDRLAKAHKRLLDEGIQNEVFILGEGSEREKLEKQVESLGIRKTFHLLGFEENPYKYISKADLFICPSRREGFSTAVTEALILGLPTVSTKCSGAEELLGKKNEFGIVVENSLEGVYQGLRQMISTPGMLESYRRKAQIRGKFFSKEKSVKSVEDMFHSLIKGEE